MKSLLKYKYWLLLALFSASASADIYMEFSPSVMSINTPAVTTRPLLLDVRLGLEQPSHQFELAFMSSIQDDSLNQLTVSVPSVISVFYHYIPFTLPRIKLQLIVGASRVNIDTSYVGQNDASDSFNGVSYGIGFEESFKSMPQLKISVDWIRLYHGEDLNINTASVGFHFDF